MTWLSTCIITNSTDAGTFVITDMNLYVPITDTNLYVPVVTLSTQHNTKLLQQLKSRFKIAII